MHCSSALVTVKKSTVSCNKDKQEKLEFVGGIQTVVVPPVTTANGVEE